MGREKIQIKDNARPDMREGKIKLGNKGMLFDMDGWLKEESKGEKLVRQRKAERLGGEEVNNVLYTFMADYLTWRDADKLGKLLSRLGMRLRHTRGVGRQSFTIEVFG